MITTRAMARVLIEVRGWLGDGPPAERSRAIGDQDVKADRHRERHDEATAFSDRLPDEPAHVVNQEFEGS